MKDNIQSVLRLDQLIFDKIEFNRIGFKNNNELNLTFSVEISRDKDNENKYITTIEIKGEKEDEYSFTVRLSGYFVFEDKINNEEKKQELLKNNSVAILMPYLRSQISSLTAQPNTDCVVLPVFNVNTLIKNNNIDVKY